MLGVYRSSRSRSSSKKWRIFCLHNQLERLKKAIIKSKSGDLGPKVLQKSHSDSDKAINCGNRIGSLINLKQVCTLTTLYQKIVIGGDQQKSHIEPPIQISNYHLIYDCNNC